MTFAKIAAAAVLFAVAPASADLIQPPVLTMTLGSVEQYRCKDTDDCFGKGCKSFTYDLYTCHETQDGHYAKLQCDPNSTVTFQEFDNAGCDSSDLRDTIRYYIGECLPIGSGSIMFDHCIAPTAKEHNLTHP